MQITNQLIEKTIEKCNAHMRTNGKSADTRSAYISAIRRFLNWQRANWQEVSGLDHEKRMEGFISSLANDKKRPITFGTQNQYFNAILYFYREFQGKPITKIKAARAPRSQRIFNVLTIEQTRSLLCALPVYPSNINLIGKLLYGTGMRIDECLSLRVKDLLFDRCLIAVQEGKGDKARFVDMPKSVVIELRQQLDYARSQFDEDRSLKRNGVYLPHGLGSKYPSYATSWEWYWAFPHFQEGLDHDDNIKRRYHVYDFDVQKAFRTIRRQLLLPEYTTPHALRHGYATCYLKNLLVETKKAGVDVPDLYGFCRDALRKKLGHVSVQTTDTYIHLVTDRSSIMDCSPLDILAEERD